jgi:hypothetical protein
MKTITLNFEQSGFLRLPFSFFTDINNVHKEMEDKLENFMSIETNDGAINSVDWLDKMVMIYDKKDEHVILSIGGEASVTITCADTVDDIVSFGHQNLCLSFDNKVLEDAFEVKHSEIVA